jgi:hypothetical protein
MDEMYACSSESIGQLNGNALVLGAGDLSLSRPLERGRDVHRVEDGMSHARASMTLVYPRSAKARGAPVPRIGHSAFPLVRGRERHAVAVGEYHGREFDAVLPVCTRSSPRSTTAVYG